MVSTGDMLRALGHMDEAAKGDAPIDNALRALAEAFRADAITMETRERASGELLDFAEWNIDPASVGPYSTHYGEISPRVAHGLGTKRNAVAHDALIGPAAAFERTEFYTDFLRHFGLRWFLSMEVDPDPAIFSVIALQFRPQHGEAQTDDIAVARQLRPLLASRLGENWRRQQTRDAGFIARDLARRFGLTPREAELAIALMRDRSVVDFANERGIAANTAYTHYAHLKDKLGLTRQAGVVRMLERLYPDHAD